MDSPCNQFIRLSYGPPLEELDRGTSVLPLPDMLSRLTPADPCRARRYRTSPEARQEARRGRHGPARGHRDGFEAVEEREVEGW
jgi:hypothetical protein